MFVRTLFCFDFIFFLFFRFSLPHTNEFRISNQIEEEERKKRWLWLSIVWLIMSRNDVWRAKWQWLDLIIQFQSFPYNSIFTFQLLIFFSFLPLSLSFQQKMYCDLWKTRVSHKLHEYIIILNETKMMWIEKFNVSFERSYVDMIENSPKQRKNIQIKWAKKNSIFFFLPTNQTSIFSYNDYKISDRIEDDTGWFGHDFISDEKYQRVPTARYTQSSVDKKKYTRNINLMIFFSVDEQEHSVFIHSKIYFVCWCQICNLGETTFEIHSMTHKSKNRNIHFLTRTQWHVCYVNAIVDLCMCLITFDCSKNLFKTTRIQFCLDEKFVDDKNKREIKHCLQQKKSVSLRFGKQ